MIAGTSGPNSAIHLVKSGGQFTKWKRQILFSIAVKNCNSYWCVVLNTSFWTIKMKKGKETEYEAKEGIIWNKYKSAQSKEVQALLITQSYLPWGSLLLEAVDELPTQPNPMSIIRSLPPMGIHTELLQKMQFVHLPTHLFIVIFSHTLWMNWNWTFYTYVYCLVTTLSTLSIICFSLPRHVIDSILANWFTS